MNAGTLVRPGCGLAQSIRFDLQLQGSGAMQLVLNRNTDVVPVKTANFTKT